MIKVAPDRPLTTVIGISMPPEPLKVMSLTVPARIIKLCKMRAVQLDITMTEYVCTLIERESEPMMKVLQAAVNADPMGWAKADDDDE